MITTPRSSLRKRMAKAALVVTVAASMSACQTLQDVGMKEGIGTVLGAVGGAAAGSQVGGGRGQLAAVAIGTLAGSYVGNSIGKSLDNADRLMAEQAATSAQTAPVGQTITWNNPDTGNRGRITPTQDGYDKAGNYCREYQTTIIVGGQEESAYGTACRKPDGSWEVVS